MSPYFSTKMSSYICTKYSSYFCTKYRFGLRPSFLPEDLHLRSSKQKFGRETISHWEILGIVKKQSSELGECIYCQHCFFVFITCPIIHDISPNIAPENQENQPSDTIGVLVSFCLMAISSIQVLVWQIQLVWNWWCCAPRDHPLLSPQFQLLLLLLILPLLLNLLLLLILPLPLILLLLLILPLLLILLLLLVLTNGT